jgi:hypothetical protein
MERYLKPFLLFVLLLSFGVLSYSAHTRIIKGTVYRNGKPASGVHVTIHKSAQSYYTSFDGKYELKADSKSKWVQFTFSDQEVKIQIDRNSGDIIDCHVPPTNGNSELIESGNKKLQDKTN